MSRVFSIKSLWDVTGVSHPWDVRALLLSIDDCAARNFDARGFPVERKRKARFDSDGSRRILLSNVRNTAERRRRAPRSRLRDGPCFGADHLARDQDAEADPGRGSPRNGQNLLGSGIRGGSKDRPDPAAVLRGYYREAGHRFVR